MNEYSLSEVTNIKTSGFEQGHSCVSDTFIYLTFHIAS